MDQSEIIVMLRSGTGVRVRESNGMLDVMVFLPPSYNTTCRTGQSLGTTTVTNIYGGTTRCYTTMGLLGTYNNDRSDDLMTLSGTITRATGDLNNAASVQMIYENFGMHC
uniref:VWFD domain-containing protein n=1 Tax=Panagrolaimus superbus TaxID=310955 RepID=A0A914YDI4_9BILA